MPDITVGAYTVGSGQWHAVVTCRFTSAIEGIHNFVYRVHAKDEIEAKNKGLMMMIGDLNGLLAATGRL